MLSGTPYYMADALTRHVGEVVFLGPDTSLTTRAILLAGRVLNQLSRLTTGKRIAPDHYRFLSVHLARQFQARIASARCDVLFAPMASVELAYLKTDIPVVYLSDLTWSNIVDYYPGASNLHGWANREAHRIESAAMHRADELIYPSQWAIDSAADDYGISRQRLHLVPFGANFPKADLPTRDQAIQHPLSNEVRLLWVGVNWQRKGGGIAYECLLSLLGMGVPAHLTVCGCVPPESFHHPQITVIPFLNKNAPLQRRQLSNLYLQSHLLLFPTQAEAYGIVVCEASAHGLPSLVRDTGGTAGMLTEGRNGFLLAADAEGSAYASKVKEIIDKPERYAALSASSRAEYEERLNWDSWGEAVRPVFEAALSSSVTAHAKFQSKVLS